MKIYITFGQIHTHRINGKTLDCDCVASFEAESLEAGHNQAMEWFDGEFHQSLTEITDDDLKYYPRGVIEI